MITEKQLRKLNDSKGDVLLSGVETTLTVTVVINDVRVAYGRVDALVTPAAGSGTKWVSAERLSLPRAGKASKG